MGTLGSEPGSHREMPPQKQKVIIGAGIIGLTSAIELQEAGYRTEIWAKDIPGKVSTLASFWEPFNTDNNKERRVRGEVWGKDTFEVLMEGIRQGVQGLNLVKGLVVFPAERDAPDWAKAGYVSSFHSMNRAEIDEYAKQHGINVPGNIRSGYTVDYPAFDMTVYMDQLMARYVSSGGKIENSTIGDISEPLSQANIVINCSGLGAQKLGDSLVYPTRGQLVKVTRPPAVSTIYCDDENPEGMVHIMPQRDHIMLGGTYERMDGNLKISTEISAAILDRCIKAMPALAQARVISEHVGLRPSRREDDIHKGARRAESNFRGGIRLERENSGLPADNETAHISEKFVVHNYGHGGNGVTYSWGCAKEVLGIVEGATRTE